MPRPCLYKENWPQLVDQYVEDQVEAGKLPTQAHLAVTVLHCDEDTINNYMLKDEYPDFHKAIKKLKSLQKHLLLEKGLLKEWQAGIVKFLLTNNHGFSQKPLVADQLPTAVTFTYVKPSEDLSLE